MGKQNNNVNITRKDKQKRGDAMTRKVRKQYRQARDAAVVERVKENMAANAAKDAQERQDSSEKVKAREKLATYLKKNMEKIMEYLNSFGTEEEEEFNSEAIFNDKDDYKQFIKRNFPVSDKLAEVYTIDDLLEIGYTLKHFIRHPNDYTKNITTLLRGQDEYFFYPVKTIRSRFKLTECKKANIPLIFVFLETDIKLEHDDYERSLMRIADVEDANYPIKDVIDVFENNVYATGKNINNSFERAPPFSGPCIPNEDDETFPADTDEFNFKDNVIRFRRDCYNRNCYKLVDYKKYSYKELSSEKLIRNYLIRAIGKERDDNRLQEAYEAGYELDDLINSGNKNVKHLLSSMGRPGGEHDDAHIERAKNMDELQDQVFNNLKRKMVYINNSKMKIQSALDRAAANVGVRGSQSA